MNEFYVIDIADSLSHLEQDFNQWQSLQFDLRKKADDVCLQKYGLTNTQFYNMQRANFLYYNGWQLQQEIAKIKFKDEQGDPLVTKNINDLPTGCTTTGEINVQADKILASRRVEQMDDEYTVIPDWLSDDTPDYDLDWLNKKYNNYLNVTQDHKNISNSYSISIWGRSVPEMYTYMKAKLQKDFSDSMDDPVPVEESVQIPAFTPDYSDQAINNYRGTIAMESSDDFQLLVRKLDCICRSSNRSLYESTILESYGDKIKIGKKTYRADIPGVVPFLQYDEYVNNPTGIDTRKIVGGMFPYILSYDEKPRERYQELQDAYNNGDTKKMLEMGWNPIVKPTMKSMNEARERQIAYLDNQYPISVYDISEYSTNISDEALKEAEENLQIKYPSSKQLKPIFLVLSTKSSETVFSKISNKLFYDKDYSHVGVSFESTLQTIYTFDSVTKNGLNRMRVDSIDDYTYDNGTVRVIAFFIRNEIYQKLKRSMKDYLTLQDNSPYTFDNAFALVADTPKLKGKSLSLICASFLDSMFKIANVYDQLTGMKNKGANIHFYILYTGNAKGYKSKETDRRVKTLQKNLDFKELNFFEPDLVLGDIQYKLLESFDIKVLGNPKADAVLKQIREILTPNDAYLEASTVDPAEQIQAISNSHKLLSSYGDTDIEAIKKEIANLMYAISKLTEFKKDNINHPEIGIVDQALDMAKKDCMIYLRILGTADKNFNLEEYIKGTPYGEKLVNVDRSIFKYDSSNLKD